MDSYLLNKILSYLITPKLTPQKFITNFETTFHTLDQLSQVSPTWTPIFTTHHYHDYLNQNLQSITFWPYQRSRSCPDLLNPVTHDRSMVSYVIKWRECHVCLQQIISSLTTPNSDLHPISECSHLHPNQAHLIFCPEHIMDLNNRHRLQGWEQLTFQLQAHDDPSGLIAKIEIILTNPPAPRRWC